MDKHRLLPTSTAENNSLSGGFIRTLLSQKNIYEKQFHVPYSVWPSWVHRSYDVKFVTQRVLQELRTSIFISLGSDAIIPTDPVDLSYWVIQNLPLENNQRLFLLNINCPNQRLRAVLSILQQVLLNILFRIITLQNIIKFICLFYSASIFAVVNVIIL